MDIVIDLSVTWGVVTTTLSEIACRLEYPSTLEEHTAWPRLQGNGGIGIGLAGCSLTIGGKRKKTSWSSCRGRSLLGYFSALARDPKCIGRNRQPLNKISRTHASTLTSEALNFHRSRNSDDVGRTLCSASVRLRKPDRGSSESNLRGSKYESFQRPPTLTSASFK